MLSRFERFQWHVVLEAEPFSAKMLAENTTTK
jgi:hypothetical protein